MNIAYKVNTSELVETQTLTGDKISGVIIIEFVIARILRDKGLNVVV